MKLKITTPDRNIYEGEIKSVSLPTERGVATIHSSHSSPLVTAIKPGLLKILTTEKLQNNHDFIISKNEIVISIGKGMAFADGETIRVVASQATTIPNHSKNTLEETKHDIENQLKVIRNTGSIEQIEKYMTKLQKINADIALEELKQCA